MPPVLDGVERVGRSLTEGMITGAAVLVSAYACDPESGSEPGAGWAWALAAASVADRVVLITRANNVAAVAAALAEARIGNVEVRGFELSTLWLWLKHRLPWGTQLYYLVWQLRSRRLVRDLERREEFAVAHHLTFAVDWMPTGLLHTRAPLVWGPVGGATRLCGWEHFLVPPRALPGELVRWLVASLGRLVSGRITAKRAAVVLAQNPDERRALRRNDLTVMPNVVVEHVETCREYVPSPDGLFTAVMVGRLIGWKGFHHGIDALAQPGGENWRLEVLGDGPLMRSLRRRATGRGVDERVTFRGKVSRSEVLATLRTADALLSPSLHEAAGFAVAEAVSVGCPVVYVAKGGPPVLVPAGGGVSVAPTRELSMSIAKALTNLPSVEPDDRWSANRLPAFLESVYARARDTQERARISGSAARRIRWRPPVLG